jgi:hypothetical protein
MANVPWFWPGVLASLVVGTSLAFPVGRALRVRPVLAGAILVSVGIIIAATLTPLRDALEVGAVGTGTCDFSRLGPPPLAELGYANDTSLNVILFIPFGLGLGLVSAPRLRASMLLVATALPFAIETIQLLAPVLARGCQSADVIDNLTGLFTGFVLGVIAKLLRRPPDRRG